MRVFVYGTLKRGQPAHERLCRGCLDVEPATIRGRLYLSQAGFPTLVVPQQSVLAFGTAIHAVDLQHEQSSQLTLPNETESSAAGCDWQNIEGELLSFEPDPRRLRIFDKYEEFRPGGSSLYLRVLVPVSSAGAIVPAWTYVSPTSSSEAFAKHLGTCWNSAGTP